MTKRWWISWVAAAALTGLTTGCQQETTTSHALNRQHGETFRPDEEPRAVDNVSFAQAAVGARSDSTLYAAHFSSHGVNSLGRAKLALMLRSDEPIDPLIVYLDLPSDVPAAPAQASVVEFLKSRGLTDAQIKVVEGANPATIHPAAPVVTSLKALAAQGASGAGASSGAPGSDSPAPAPAAGPAETPAK